MLVIVLFVLINTKLDVRYVQLKEVVLQDCVRHCDKCGDLVQL